MELHYPTDRSTQILISLLKAHGIKKVVASPGTTNAIFVAGIQNDSFFQVFSSADERSAAYMACGMAQASNEPVVITCTEATASRNYLPALTEAYYRNLPILAITGYHDKHCVGNLYPQAIDRSQAPKDTVRYSTVIEHCRNQNDEWHVNLEINKAILELSKNGGGPVHIDMQIGERWDFFTKELPPTRVLRRINTIKQMPSLPNGKIAIVIGTHAVFTERQTVSVEKFCANHNAVVISGIIGNYYGNYRTNLSLLLYQKEYLTDLTKVNLIIHIGGVGASTLQSSETWRISEDGQICDTFHNLKYNFELSIEDFFDYYSDKNTSDNLYYKECIDQYNQLQLLIPELPFSNAWIAHYSYKLLPNNAIAYFGILNSHRVWDMYDIDRSIITNCNYGGFGIDGGISTMIGSSIILPHKIHYCIVGDLAFFYDMNVLGNRHIGKNVRIILINNGRGNEFRNCVHPAYKLGEAGNQFVAAAGHYGNQSSSLVKHYAEDLGYEYASAISKEDFQLAIENTKFFSNEACEKSIIIEVFTDEKSESESLGILSLLLQDKKTSVKTLITKTVSQIIGDEGIAKLRNLMK